MATVKRNLYLFALTGALAAGCQTVPTRSINVQWEPLPSGPVLSRTKEIEGFIASIEAPSVATVNMPVKLTVRSMGGRNSCESFGGVYLDIDHASRSVTVKSTLRRPEGDGFSCAEVMKPFVETTIGFIPEATGTYLVTAAGFLPYGDGVVATPSSTQSITVLPVTAN